MICCVFASAFVADVISLIQHFFNAFYALNFYALVIITSILFVSIVVSHADIVDLLYFIYQCLKKTQY